MCIRDSLDTQTPQIQIEARIVEMDEGYQKQIGLRRGLSFGYDPVGVKGVSPSSDLGTANNIGGTGGTGTGAATTGLNNGPGFSLSSAPSATNNGVFAGLMIGQYRRLLNLDLSLQLMENQSKGKVISSPKIITQNGKKATISSQEDLPFAQQTVNPGDNAADTTCLLYTSPSPRDS